MKKLLCILLILCLTASSAFAEGQEETPESVWESFEKWVGQAAEDTSAWVSQAWDDSTEWVDSTWGSVSGWVNQTWNESTQWVTGIWGDVVAGTSELYGAISDSVSMWWTTTYERVTGTANDVWTWISGEAEMLTAGFREEYEAIRDAIIADGKDTETKVRNVFILLLKRLQVSESDSLKIWDTVKAYAEMKKLSYVTLAKLALPFLLQLIADAEGTNESIPAIEIAKYLTAILENLDIMTEQDAVDLVSQLTDALSVAQ